MKQTLAILATLLIWCLLVYLVFSFIGWQMDPYYWNDGGRLFYVLVGPVTGVAFAFTVAGNNDTPDCP